MYHATKCRRVENFRYTLPLLKYKHFPRHYNREFVFQAAVDFVLSIVFLNYLSCYIACFYVIINLMLLGIDVSNLGRIQNVRLANNNVNTL